MTDSKKIDDGGLAFPGRRWEQVGNVSDHGFPIDGDDSPTYGDVEYSGMSLRDWLAGQAISSIPLRSWDHLGPNDEDRIKAWARCSYLVADAMIAARKAGG